jgi:hypothetical protein
VTPEEVVREARAAAAAMKTKPLPGALGMLAGHPGVLAYEYDSPEEYENDQRRAELLRRLSDYAEQNKLNPLGTFGPDLSSDINAYRRGEVDNTPYHYRGYLAPGSPWSNAFQVLGGLAGTAYQGSRRLANAIDPAQNRYPDAKEGFDRALNTLTMYGAEDYGLVPRGTGTTVEITEEARRARGKAPWDAGVEGVKAYNELLAQGTQDKMDRAIPTGYNHLSELGAPYPVAMMGGAVMDMILDPNPAFLGAAMQARRGLPAMRELISETSLGGGPSAAAVVPYMWDESMNYLHGLNGQE